VLFPPKLVSIALALHSAVCRSKRRVTISLRALDVVDFSNMFSFAAVRQTVRLSRFFQNTRYFQSEKATSSTVNATEIAHFSRLSSSWWDERGELAMLHRMNPVRVRYIREKLLESIFEDQGEDARREMASRRQVLTGMDVLDVGCGGGLLSEVRLSFTTQCDIPNLLL